MLSELERRSALKSTPRPYWLLIQVQVFALTRRWLPRVSALKRPTAWHDYLSYTCGNNQSSDKCLSCVVRKLRRQRGSHTIYRRRENRASWALTACTVFVRSHLRYVNTNPVWAKNERSLDIAQFVSYENGATTAGKFVQCIASAKIGFLNWALCKRIRTARGNRRFMRAHSRYF